MNKQLHYIIAAFLVLIVFTGLFLFIKKIPVDHSDSIVETNVETTQLPVISTELSTVIAKGKILFLSKCASCHHLFKNSTGPELHDVIDNDQWSDRKKLYAWIRNPAAFMKEDAYTQGLKTKYGSMMTAFPDLSDLEIDAIVEYINYAGKASPQIMPVARR